MSQRHVPVATPIGAATEPKNDTETPPSPTAPSYVPSTAQGPQIAEGIPVSVQNERVKNGMCPTCGAQVYTVKKSLFTGRKLKPLTIMGKVDRGRCLVCHPDNAASNQNTNNASASTTTSQNVPLTPAAAAISQVPSNEQRWVKNKTFVSNGIKGLYEGEVDDVGRRDGYGTIRWADGDSFVGEWHNDLKEGHGAYTWANGNVYVGQWRNGKREGRGKWTWHDGSEFDGNVYEGEWKDNKKEGWGKYIWHKSGNVYEGEWKNNKKEGRGKFTFVSSGDVREGRWRNGVVHGKAIFRCKGGDVYDQVWDNGKLVSNKKR